MAARNRSRSTRARNKPPEAFQPDDMKNPRWRQRGFLFGPARDGEGGFAPFCRSAVDAQLGQQEREFLGRFLEAFKAA